MITKYYTKVQMYGYYIFDDAMEITGVAKNDKVIRLLTDLHLWIIMIQKFADMMKVDTEIKHINLEGLDKTNNLFKEHRKLKFNQQE